MPYTKIALRLPAALTQQQVQWIGDSLEALIPTHTAQREKNDKNAPWLVNWFCEDAPQREQILTLLEIGRDAADLDISFKSLTIEELPDENWLEKSYAGFQPFHLGPFFIYGSHYDGEIPASQMPLQIDAATAFGSGEHGTTKGCLLAMIDLKHQGICPWNVLDMGTGSGILAIAAWKLWQTPILAVDIDAESVRVAKRHQEMNHVKDSAAALTCIEGDGFDASIVQKKAPYELVIANILAGPLIEMAPAMETVMDTGSYAILSGLRTHQAEDVQDAYISEGLTIKKRNDIDGWTTLVLHKA